ncbi:hypothetical protein ACTHTU_01310 [Neisseria sp. P0020.S005]|jgi:hypothetical protein
MNVFTVVFTTLVGIVTMSMVAFIFIEGKRAMKEKEEQEKHSVK